MDRTVRLFIAIDLPRSVKQLLRSTQARLKPQLAGVRWVDPDGAHLTLKFLGATPADRITTIAAELARAVTDVPPFRLRTGAPGAFPSVRRPRVLWIGVAGDLQALRMTHAAVERAIAPLGFPTEDRPFTPHLTLGRVSHDARPAELERIGHAIAAAKEPPAVEFAVEAVTLLRSELSRAGARYSMVARAPLDGGG